MERMSLSIFDWLQSAPILLDGTFIGKNSDLSNSFHSKWPKLYEVLAALRAIGLNLSFSCLFLELHFKQHTCITA